ncbi:alpha/beta hydrolase [Glaciibacter superstes]|uniref:alpha/beta hydrolase n=1 Tax=Glaciibacter superstes TaxID=501023 RepID=UPI00041BEB89|nr:alpha/beta hydrolase [Glaciibacter superstes]
MTEAYGAADGLVRVYPADSHGEAGQAGQVGQTPALVWAHGGGFRGGDLDMPEAHWTSGALAARGITVVSVDYRHAGDGFRYPLPSDDILTAWAWTLDHADELGIDKSRLAIGGASAGANLVTGAVLRMLADDTRSLPLPAGIFLAYPTLLAEQPAPDAELAALLAANPAAAHGPSYVPDMYENYFGGPVDDAPLAVVPGRAVASDLTGFPPVLMINSEIDHLRVSGEVFAATLANAGIPLELATEPGALHGHLNRPDESAASDSIERIARWIARGFVPDTSVNQTTPSTTAPSTTEGNPS